MSLSLIAACFWVLIAALVAMLPMRLQYPPGITLLILVPFGLGWIAYDHGWLYALAGFLAFASMFRNPLIYFWRRAFGKTSEVPK